MSSCLAKTNTGNLSMIAEIESQSKKVSCSMSCKLYLISKRLLKRNNSCVVLLKYLFVSLHLVAFFSCVHCLLGCRMIGFNCAHELLCTT